MEFNYNVKILELEKIQSEISPLTNEPLIAAKISAMNKLLAEKENENTLNIAVCGQYSSGKSTLIKAMTGIQDIKIDQDVCTSDVTVYPWHGVNIADTPGIGAGRDKNHDELSLDYINKADLLVYMLTIQGFDRITATDFKHLIFDKKYLEKTMLVMNKRNMEPAENEPNWRNDILKILGGQDIVDKLRFTIIDAEDYLQGVADKDDDFLKESHFENFIQNLNEFIEKKGQLGKVLARANIIDNFITLTIEEMKMQKNQDEFDRRLYVVINNAIRNYDKIIHDNSIRIRREITELGNAHISLLADETLNEFNENQKNINFEIEKILTNRQLGDELNSLQAEVQEDLKEVNTSAVDFEQKLATLSSQFPDINVSAISDFSGFKDNFSMVTNFLSNKGNLSMISSILGKKSGTFLGKCSSLLGKAAPWITMGIEAYNLWKSKQHQDEMDSARNVLRQGFKELVDNITSEIDNIKNDESSFYVKLLNYKELLLTQEEERKKLNQKRQEIFEKLSVIKDTMTTYINSFSN